MSMQRVLTNIIKSTTFSKVVSGKNKFNKFYVILFFQYCIHSNVTYTPNISILRNLGTSTSVFSKSEIKNVCHVSTYGATTSVQNEDGLMKKLLNKVPFFNFRRNVRKEG